MTAVDTNVLVRVLVRDDPVQVAVAIDLLRAGPVLVPKTVLLETAWVLRTLYGLPRGTVLRSLQDVAAFGGAEIEDAPSVARALAWAEAGMDIADAFHLASAGGATSFATFDRRLARTAAKAGGTPRVNVLSGR